MSRPTRLTYKTRNWPSYNEALKRRGSLTIWFDPEMIWEAAAGRRGRQQCRHPDLPLDEGAIGPREPANGSHIGDAPVLPDLLNQIPAEEEIGSVTADGAYDTRKCHDAIADRGAHAVIPPRRNAKPWKTVTAGAAARNEALRAVKYLGRALWRRWSGYHRRSRRDMSRARKRSGGSFSRRLDALRETAGQCLMARDFDRQVAELQVRIAVLNSYTALGMPVTEAVG